MASNHGLTNRKVLLPFETELCNTLGISKEEYFQYLERAQLTPVRSEEYALIPDVKNDAATIAIVSLVVGLASTAASILLAPKPNQKRPEPINVQKGDQIGENKFTPSSDFGSIQDLAKLGQIVPLIFTDRDDIKDIGGTRSNSLLTLSMISAVRSSLRVRAIAVTTLKELQQRPDFDGIAIGDQLLRDYSGSRFQAFGLPYESRKDGRIQRGDRYDEGVLDINISNYISNSYWHPLEKAEHVFSGARTPSNKTEFGAYAPMPNGNNWKLDFQMFILPDASDGDEKDRVRSMRSKIESDFPLYAAITDIDGDVVTYTMNNINSRNEFKQYYTAREGVSPEDIRNQINQQRVFIDDNISEGELYMLANRVAVCIERPNERFIPESNNPRDYVYKFRYVTYESGEYDGYQTMSTRDIKAIDDHWNENNYQIQRFADAIVSNNQTCDCTEIGIASTVYKRIAGANINNFPGGDRITEMENNDAGGTYDIGRMDMYLPRYSVFMLQIKKEEAAEWKSTPALFAVKGERPVEQHNAIRIYHPRGQHEYRLRPYPSKLAFYRNKERSKPLYLLDARKGLDVDRSEANFVVADDGFIVYFEGKQIKFTDISGRNPETFKGQGEISSSGGEVISLSSNSSESDSGGDQWQNDPGYEYFGPPSADVTDSTRSYVIRRDNFERNEQIWVFFWRGQKVGNIERPISNPITNPGRDAIVYPTNTLRYRSGNNIKHETTESGPNAINRYWYEIARQSVGEVKNPIGSPVIRSASTASGVGIGLKVSIQEYGDGSYTWSIVEAGSGYVSGDSVIIPVVNETVTVTATEVNVRTAKDDPGWWSDGDMYPYHAVTDYRNHDTESCSNTDGPEHRVTYVNEIQDAPDESRGTYENLSSIALIINSSRELNTLNQISAYYTKGLKIRKFGSEYRGKEVYGASNIFPEIAFYLMTNRVTGAGAVINENQIDIESFHKAADYCRQNDFYWDGVLDQRVNLREFLFEQGSYCLLDFTMKGGQFGFVPSVPVNENMAILRDEEAKPNVVALFTDGNIRDMRVQTLTPEDRKAFEAEILWRKEYKNKFSEKRTTNVRFENYTRQSVETYDMTQFCTSRKQTTQFGKFALQVRKWIDHNIEFQTTPESAAGIEPADYIRVVSHVCHPDRFQNGCVTPDGHIVSSRPIPDGTRIYYWRPDFSIGNTTNEYIKTGEMRYDEATGIANNELRGCIFSVINQISTNRVYKVDTISIGEEGFVQITASHMPLTDTGALQIMQDWEDTGSGRGFIVNDNDQ